MKRVPPPALRSPMGARARRVVGLLLAVLAALCAPLSTGHAQQGTPGPSLPPDVVRTLDGALYRGTIVELVPDGYVVIATMSGELVRLPMDEVAYCGPADDAPPGPPPAGPDIDRWAPAPATPAPATPAPATPAPATPAPATPAPPTPAPPTPAPPTPAPQTPEPQTPAATDVRVHVEANEPGLRLHRVTGGVDIYSGGYAIGLRSYEPMCAIPCTLDLPAGQILFGLSQPDGAPVQAEEPLRLEPGDFILRGDYYDRQGVRTAGTVLFYLGLAAGTGMMLGDALSFDEDDLDDEGLGTLFWAGLTTLTVSTVVGLLMQWAEDEADFEVSPVPTGI